jgi:TolB-like protein
MVANPSDVNLALQLAAAYRETDRADEALSLVESLRAEFPEDQGLTVMAGLLQEDAGDFGEALRLYESYLTDASSGALRDEVERRLELVRLEELRADVRASLSRESELAATTPDPAAVGVFPFVYEGDDPSWEPLSHALAELLITDLGITGRLTVLERVKIQTLLDELALSEAGFVEEATAARSGRLLGSGHVVQGRYRIDAEQRIGVDAAVVAVGEPGEVRVEPIQAEDEVARLFDLEKQLALDLHAEIGIQLTPAERARINERHTESVQALLAFGRGLQATDAGDFRQAEQHFAEAVDIDPAFGMAQARRQSAARASAVRSVQATRQLQAQAQRLAKRRAAVQALRNAPASVRQQILKKLGQRKRAVLAEVLGQDRIGQTILLELVFRRPGGDE